MTIMAKVVTSKFSTIKIPEGSSKTTGKGNQRQLLKVQFQVPE
jgi:hypothetical protein